MARRRVNKYKSARAFRKGTSRAKAVNFARPGRGGFRL